MLEGWQAKIQTTTVGILQSYDPATNTAEVQVAISSILTNPDGTTTNISGPFLVDAPVHWPGGGAFLLTFPLTAGDEVQVNFGSRGIDYWFQNGGQQPPTEARMHNFSDGFISPKLYSLPKVPPSISTTTAQFRNFAGTAYLELAAGGVINIVAPGGLNINGSVVATGEGTFDGHTVGHHIHTQGNDSHGDTEVPTNMPTG